MCATASQQMSFFYPRRAAPSGEIRQSTEAGTTDGYGRPGWSLRGRLLPHQRLSRWCEGGCWNSLLYLSTPETTEFISQVQMTGALVHGRLLRMLAFLPETLVLMYRAKRPLGVWLKLLCGSTISAW